MKQKKAILYIRVSTDEQAEKGYSLLHQEDRLKQYCQFQNIEVVDIYKDDHSAKTFERPQFKKLLSYLYKNRGAIDVLLFLKWDRFSRNAGDAYGMIKELTKLNVEPQAIEQPLDLSIPENKMMLAFYLAAPEVENDRRSLNIIAGMRRAAKDGRHVHKAPFGYTNARNEHNRKVIIPNKDAQIIQWSFEEIAKGLTPVVDVWMMAKQKGLKCSKNQFWYILRSPVYYGKIFVPAYKNEEAVIVNGQHEAIISEILFDDVQDVLDGRKRNVPSKNTAKEELPLRGFLQCKKCGCRLSGSASKGKGGRYFYYHCTKGCNERFRSDLANNKIAEELEQISSIDEAAELLGMILKSHYNKDLISSKNKATQLEAEIAKSKERLKKAQQLLIDGVIETEDYNDIKAQHQTTISQINKNRWELKDTEQNIDVYVDFTIDLFRNLSDLFRTSDLAGQQQVLSLLYPEKLIFENNAFRTPKMNEALALISSTDKGFEKEKTGLKEDFSYQSGLVEL